jgi:hypothetical protein
MRLHEVCDPLGDIKLERKTDPERDTLTEVP